MLDTMDMRAWRRRLGLTQRQAAAMLGLSERCLRGYERGEQMPPRAVVLACHWIEQSLENPPPKRPPPRPRPRPARGRS